MIFHFLIKHDIKTKKKNIINLYFIYLCLFKLIVFLNLVTLFLLIFYFSLFCLIKQYQNVQLILIGNIIFYSYKESILREL